jgi:hypothetical protein
MLHPSGTCRIHGDESDGFGVDQRLNQPDPWRSDNHLGRSKGALDPKNRNDAEQILIMVEWSERRIKTSENNKSLIKINVSFVIDLQNISTYAPYTTPGSCRSRG